MLKKATPYMVNKNGEIIDVSPIHPYIKYHIEDNNEKSIIKLINEKIRDLKWFYNNTKHISLKEDIDLLLVSLLDNKNISSNIIKDNFKLNNNLIPLKTNYDIEQLFELINNQCNQEFLRMRTSNLKFGGNSNDTYFRISSINFNWFTIIWNIVYNNKDFISSITITNDTQSTGGSLKYYNHNGILIKDLPTNEFLTLPGNPIIESKEKSFNENFENIHPAHINKILNSLRDIYIEENFS